MQPVFDANLLIADGEVTMIEARDALLAADIARFGGANQTEPGRVREARLRGGRRGRPGAGETADTDDPDPVPRFNSPLRSAEATLTFTPVDEGGAPVAAELYVGDYEANVTPVADTHPDTTLGAIKSS